MIKTGMYISDRYEIIDKVGSGGMADVYKALCHRLNRYVAIKILKPEYSTDASFVQKFRAEAQSVAGLSHPNIVSVYDVGEDDGLYYIVMELVEGITLKRFIEKSINENGFFKWPILNILFRPAFYFILLMFTTFAALYKKKRIGFIMITYPLLYMGTLFFGPLVYFRYIYPIILTVPVLIAVVLFDKVKE